MQKTCFRYSATDRMNRKVSGKITADNFSSAYSNLKSQSFRKIKIQIIHKKTKILNFLNNRSLTTLDVAIFTRQLATMQSAGIPLLRALYIISNDVSKPLMLTIINNIKNRIESGTSLADALANQPEFDSLFVSLVAIGESSGKLDLILQDLAIYKEKNASLKAKIRSAMYYPCIVLAIACIVSIILLIKVVPTFKIMFEGLGADLPKFTKFVLYLSHMLQGHKYEITLVTILILWLIKHFSKYVIFKIPILRIILQKVIIARFTRTLAISFAAGMPLPKALLLLAKVCDNTKYQRSIILIYEGILAGKSIHDAMQMTELFPPMTLQMVAIGEETGTLDNMLKKVASIYEEELDLAMERMTTLLEPLLMIVLGVLVGGLVIAMYMPIFNLGAIV